MTLTGSQLNEHRRVPYGDQTSEVDFPEAGNALNWGDRLTWDNNPETDPYGEASKTTYVVAWDGKERKFTVDGKKVTERGAKIPVFVIRIDKWLSSHGNLGAFVIAKKLEDSERHTLVIHTENTGKGISKAPVSSNTLSYEVS